MRALITYFVLFAASAPVLTAQSQTLTQVAGGGPYNLTSTQVGLPGPAGIAVSSSNLVYLALTGKNHIWSFGSQSVANYLGTGNPIYLSAPQGIASDGTILYIADTGNNRVSKTGRLSSSASLTTIAGTGASGNGGDGGLATSAQLNAPTAVAVGPDGSVYIVDQGNNRVRRISPDGTINAFAGNGSASFSGDGGPAIAATLNRPTAVAVSGTNVYIADSSNFRVRKVAGGIISTAAGTGSSGYSGDGGPATSAQLNGLNGLALDSSGNLYIVETNDVRLISANQANITTYAGSSTAGYSGDGGAPTSAKFMNLAALTFDASSTAYLVDAGNLRICKISAGVVSTFAGNGTVDAEFGYSLFANPDQASSINLLTPNSIAALSTGGATFSDIGSSSIRKLVNDGGMPLNRAWNVSLLAGNGFAISSPDLSGSGSPLKYPTGLAYDSASVLHFTEENRVRKLESGIYSTIANASNIPGFSGDGGLASTAQFNSPSSLTIASNGDVYVADSLNNRVRVINNKTGVVTTIAGTGGASSTGDGGLATSAALNNPVSVSLDGLGNLYVCEFLGNRVRKIVLGSNYITTVAGDGTTNFADGVLATATGLYGPTSVAADQAGNIFIADQEHFRVRKVTAGSNVIGTVAGDGNSSNLYPVAIALTPLPQLAGNDGYGLYITDAFGSIKVKTVVACFYTVSNPLIYAGSGGSTGSATFTASDSSCPYPVSSGSSFVTITGSSLAAGGTGTISFSIAANSGLARTAVISIGGQTFSILQAGSTGQQNIGVFRASAPIYVLDVNGNGTYDGPPDKFFNFLGQPGDIAVAGDWNHDGRTKVGIYRNGFWILDYNGNGVWDDVAGGDSFYGFGGTGYTPIVGDWNGDGRTKIGFYFSGFWALDMDGDGSFTAADKFFGFGGNGAGEVPILGDWNGDGRTKIGFYFNGTWALDYNGDGTFNIGSDKYFTGFPYAAGDKPVVGDWTGDGRTKIGILRGGTWILDSSNDGLYGPGDKALPFGGKSSDVPTVGDWNGSGTSKIGYYGNGAWYLGDNGTGTFSRSTNLGIAGDQPLIGRW